jgi:hypothetical protein
MQSQASLVSDDWAALLSRFPADLDLARLGRETGAFLRPRGVPDAATLLRLALVRGPGGLSVDQTAAWAEMAGIARLSGPSLHDRLHRSVEFLQEITRRLLVRPVSEAGLWAGRHLRLADSTSLSEAGSAGTDWRLHAVYDLAGGRFTHLDLTDGHGGEALDRGDPIAGELRVCDRGFCNGPAFARYLRQAEAVGADFIVRMKWRGLKLWDAAGRAFDLFGLLDQIAAPGETTSASVQMQVGKDKARLPLRVIAVRLPDDRAEANRKKLLKSANRQQTTPEPNSLLAAGFVIVATSLPAAIPAEDVLATYRLRWQIELAFKRLKSLLHIDRLPTHTQRGGQSWLYAHLILALLCEDLTQDFLDSFP